MSFIRTKKVGKYTYYQRVRNYRDDEGRPRQEVLEHLGPNPPGNDRRLNNLEATLVSDEIIKHEPTQDEIRRLLESLDVPTGDWDYERIGVELDVLKKTRHLRLK